MREKWKYVPHLIWIGTGMLLIPGCTDGADTNSMKTNATPVPPTSLPQPIATSIPTPTPTRLANEVLLGQNVWLQSQQEFENAMEQVPDILKRSAVRVSFFYGDHPGTAGSGVIVDYDHETGIVWGLTAGHIIKSSDVDAIALNRPHDEGTNPQIIDEDFYVSWSEPDGLAVFAFRHPDGFRMGRVGVDNLQTDWVPSTDDVLQTLGFPSLVDPITGEQTTAVYPDEHIVISETGYNSGFGTVYTTDSPFAAGASGAGYVQVDSNTLVAIHIGSLDNSSIYPIPSAQLEVLLDNVLSRFDE